MSYSSDYLAFRMNSTSATPVLALNDSGKVGIGATSPTDFLEVNGQSAYPHLRFRSSSNT